MSVCPKCNHRRSPADSHVHEGICPSCGIAYAKWRSHAERSASNAEDAPVAYSSEPHEEPFLVRLGAQLVEVPDEVDGSGFAGRCALLAAIAAWSAWFILHGIDWQVIGGSFLHNANLAFHEFGHVFFSPFGEFMAILGGSLFQVLLPLLIAGVFAVKQHDNFAASVALWWCGQNFVDLSPYIRDAEFRALPLVGGRGEESHDWGNLLGRLDAVDTCYALAHMSFGIGSMLMLAAIAWGGWLLFLMRENLRQ